MTESVQEPATVAPAAAGSPRIALATLNHAGPEAFADELAGIFEHGRWIAEAAAELRPFGSRDDLHAAMAAVVRKAGEAKQIELILAHPDLAGPRLDRTRLTAESASEQRSVGLQEAAEAAVGRLVAANEAYRDRFGFSCIVCVRRQGDLDSIIDTVRRRTSGTREEQIVENLDEIDQIALLRLRDKVAAGWVTTHVLDTTRGEPGSGMRVAIARRAGDRWAPVKTLTTNADGRTDEPLLTEAEMLPGHYEVRFHVGQYFAHHGVPTAPTPYLGEVPVEVHLGDGDAHYHVPLIVSPWGYTTYRGS